MRKEKKNVARFFSFPTPQKKLHVWDCMLGCKFLAYRKTASSLTLVFLIALFEYKLSSIKIINNKSITYFTTLFYHLILPPYFTTISFNVLEFCFFRKKTKTPRSLMTKNFQFLKWFDWICLEGKAGAQRWGEQNVKRCVN